jgi:hypothetical protein
MSKNRIISHLLSAFYSLLFLSACKSESPTDGEQTKPETEFLGQHAYSIGYADHVSLAEKALNHIANFEYDQWSEMLSDDVGYYYPDGDADTRTRLIGKTILIDYMKNWHATSGIERMAFTNDVHIPVIANETMDYSGLTGPLVLSYFSNEMVFEGKEPIRIRMNFVTHINEDNLIDRYYTYYDRTTINEAMNNNMLKNDSVKKSN